MSIYSSSSSCKRVEANEFLRKQLWDGGPAVIPVWACAGPSFNRISSLPMHWRYTSGVDAMNMGMISWSFSSRRTRWTIWRLGCRRARIASLFQGKRFRVFRLDNRFLTGRMLSSEECGGIGKMCVLTRFSLKTYPVA